MSNADTPRWGNPTFWLLVVLAFGNVFAERNLGVYRPEITQSAQAQSARVRSRLWQDPNEAVGDLFAGRSEEVQEKMAGGTLRFLDRELTHRLRSKPGPPNEGEDEDRLLVLPVQIEQGPSAEAHESRLRTRYAVTTALIDSGFTAGDSEHLERLVFARSEGRHGTGSDTPYVCIPYQWFDGAAGATDRPASVLVLWIEEEIIGDAPLRFHERLAANLLGGTTPKERRRVDVRVVGPTDSDKLRALLEEAEVDEAAECYLTVLDAVQNPTSNLLEASADTPRSEQDAEMRAARALEHLAECLHVEGPRRWAFLRRLDSQAEGLDNVADALGNLPRSLPEDSRLGRILAGARRDRILGRIADEPARVWERAMVRRARPGTAAGLHGGIEILSSHSTAPLGAMWPGEGEIGDCEKHTTAAACYPGIGLHVQRMIGLDGRLADGLVRELARRIPALMPELHDWEPAAESGPGWSALRGVLSRVGFLQEADLRAISIALVAEQDTLYGQSWEATLNEAWTDYADEHWTRCPPRVHFTQVPFLRGIDGRVAGQSLGEKAPEDLDYPADHGQIDYLRRLQRAMREGGAEFQAIGVLGSDVYDKLLILEALTPLFPDAIFFTTDLDVRFGAELHLGSTRNLVSASHYDLERRPDIRSTGGGDFGDFLPRFRDSYQKADYLATAAAVAAGAESSLPVPPELEDPDRAYLFEVGSSGLIDLAEGGSSPAGGSGGATETGEGIEPLLLPAFSLLILLIVFVGLSPLYQGLRRFANNVTWPVWWATWALGAVSAGGALFLWWQIPRQEPGGEPFYVTAGVSVWPAVILRFVGGVFCWGSMLYIAVEARTVRRGIEQDLLGLESTARGWEQTPATLAVLGEGLKTTLAATRSVGQAARTGPAAALERLRLAFRRDHATVQDLWVHRYVYWDRAGWRLLRSLVYAIVFVNVLRPIFDLLGRPGSPARGVTALLLDKGSTFAFVISLLTLIFFVLESSFFAATFLRDLMEDGVGEWPEEKEEPDGDAAEGTSLQALRRRYLPVRLTADLTRVVQAFVYFPALGVCILLASRLEVFDRWSWPAALILAFGLVLLFLVVCAANLSMAGRGVKTLSVRRLGDLRSKAGSDKEARERIDARLADLEALKDGAFAPLTRHPLARAALLPFAFLGSGSLIAWAGLLGGG